MKNPTKNKKAGSFTLFKIEFLHHEKEVVYCAA